MSFYSWLEQIFSLSSAEKDDQDNTGTDYTFAWNQNSRIILAIIIVILSAMCMWWIVS